MNRETSENQAAENLQRAWRQRLPVERQRLFESQTTEWERSYAMFSLTLHSALEARLAGELIRARQEVACAADLARRLHDSMIPTLDALRRNRLWGSEPRVEPLQPADYQRQAVQEAATWNRMLHWPLLLRRWQFAWKLRSLREAACAVIFEFCEMADEIAQGLCVDPNQSWKALEGLHDDLNTVMQESLVVLKSFLCAVTLEGFRRFLAALGEIKVKGFEAERGVSPASP